MMAALYGRGLSVADYPRFTRNFPVARHPHSLLWLLIAAPQRFTLPIRIPISLFLPKYLSAIFRQQVNV